MCAVLDHLWYDVSRVESIYCWYHLLEYLSTAGVQNPLGIPTALQFAAGNLLGTSVVIHNLKTQDPRS
jgi:hypothetical protein